MRIQRRQFLCLVAGTASFSALPSVARAQTYPSMPVTIVVGFPPGGGIDLNAKMMAQWLSARLGQPFKIQNRPGPGTNAATESVVHAQGDGSTLLLASAANAIGPALFSNLNFNFIRDMAPVAGIARAPAVMVTTASSSSKTVADFIAHAQANAGKVTIGSTAVGTPPYMAAALFRTRTGIKVLQTAYPSDAAGVADLLAGKIEAHFAGAGAVMEHIRSGRLRALAITTSTRLAFLSNVPAMAEVLPGYEASTWIGLAVPRSTSKEIVETLGQATSAGLRDAEIISQLAQLGYAPMPMSASEFEKFIAEETTKWRQLVASIRPK